MLGLLLPRSGKPVRSYLRPGVRFPVHHAQQFGGVYIGNRPPADPRENVPFQSPDDAVAVMFGRVGGLLGVPLSRHHFKTVRRPQYLCGHLCLAVLAGVDAIGQQFARLVAAFSRVL